MSFRVVKDYKVVFNITNKFGDKTPATQQTISTRDVPVLEDKAIPVQAETEESLNRNPGYASDALGYKSTSIGFASLAHGKESVARLRTQIAHAGGSFIAPGDVQYARTILKARNTKTTVANFKLDDVEEYIIQGKQTSVLLNVKIFGASDDPNRKCYYGEFRGLLKTYATEPHIVLEQVDEKVIFGPPQWKVDMSVEPTGIVRFTATVRAQDLPGDIRWFATLESFEHYHDTL